MSLAVVQPTERQTWVVHWKRDGETRFSIPMLRTFWMFDSCEAALSAVELKMKIDSGWAERWLEKHGQGRFVAARVDR